MFFPLCIGHKSPHLTYKKKERTKIWKFSCLTIWGPFLAILSIFHLLWSLCHGNLIFCENMIFRFISRYICNSFSKLWFLILMAFLGYFWAFFLCIFCPWTSYRSHILNQEYFCCWKYDLYQEISYEMFIFDHILGGGAGIWKLATGLLRSERSYAARRCACFLILFFSFCNFQVQKMFSCQREFTPNSCMNIPVLSYLLDRCRESTAFCQILQSFILAASFPVMVVPVSLFCWSTNVVIGHPLPRCPWVGSQRIN